jgi:class 3 adenylate cyclase
LRKAAVLSYALLYRVNVVAGVCGERHACRGASPLAELGGDYMQLLDAKRIFDAFLEERSGDIEHATHELWLSRDEGTWHSEPYFYVKLGETADKLGQVMFAHDILQEGLRYFPDQVRLTQLFALALVKCGFITRARDLLSGLMEKGHKDEETLGILGRVYKDLWLLSGGALENSEYLRQSRDLYLEAFRRNRGYYSGINAASMSLMLGDNVRAEKLAKVVLKICITFMKDAQERDYWGLATLGEGFLLLKKFKEAGRYYGLARKRGGKNFSYLASTRKQLLLLSRFMDVPEDVVGILDIPPIIAFTGHMIDSPGRKVPRFPPSIEGRIKAALASALDEHNPGIGYSSAACGSDILFLELMQERKAETNVVLPFELDDFFKISVDFAGVQWRERAQSVLQHCTRRVQATEGKYLGDDLLFDYANHVIMGKALLRSSMLETEAVLLAVWDPGSGAATGGTSDFVQTWNKKQLPVHIIDITKVDRTGTNIDEKGAEPVASEEPAAVPRFKNVHRVLKVMLFADLVGFGSLKEEQIPFYINRYMKGFEGIVKKRRFKPHFMNTWGDALYFVFDDPVAAAECALELKDYVTTTQWEDHFLPADLNIRIGLHVGPVFGAKEPLVNRMNYFGRHVNWAARIEPITNPGNVYASEQFASMLMTRSDHELEARYVGIIVLPKQFGTYPIYLVKRTHEIQ